MIMKNNPAKRIKNTNCPFSMCAKILLDQSLEFPCTIEIKWNHNHGTNTLQAWSYKDLTEEAVNTIKQYFMNGMTPGTAYKEFVDNLRISCGTDILAYHRVLADRGTCPRRRDFNALYVEFNKEKYGGSDVKAMLDNLEERIATAKEKHPDISIRYKPCDDSNPLLLAIVTPLMHRIHQHISESGELVFIDSSSNMEEYNLRVFLLVTQSVLGALPLGILITSDEKTETLIQGFTLLKDCFNENSFYGKGPDGPKIAMTDNCAELRDALSLVFRNIELLLLCTFHILQQVWRWVTETKHGINGNDKRYLLQSFIDVVYVCSF